MICWKAFLVLQIAICHVHTFLFGFWFWFVVCGNGRAAWRARSAIGCVSVCFVAVVGCERFGCVAVGWSVPVCQRGLGLLDSMVAKPSLQALRAETMVERFTARMHVVCDMIRRVVAPEE